MFSLIDVVHPRRWLKPPLPRPVWAQMWLPKGRSIYRTSTEVTVNYSLTSHHMGDGSSRSLPHSPPCVSSGTESQSFHKISSNAIRSCLRFEATNVRHFHTSKFSSFSEKLKLQWHPWLNPNVIQAPSNLKKIPTFLVCCRICEWPENRLNRKCKWGIHCFSLKILSTRFQSVGLVVWFSHHIYNRVRLKTHFLFILIILPLVLQTLGM